MTGCADELMAAGDYEIYQSTYEKLAHEVKEAEAAAAQPEEDPNAVRFHYKWTDTPDAELFGPYTAAQMAEWQDQDFFKGGVLCREVGKEEFYNSKRVDFELFT